MDVPERSEGRERLGLPTSEEESTESSGGKEICAPGSRRAGSASHCESAGPCSGPFPTLPGTLPIQDTATEGTEVGLGARGGGVFARTDLARPYFWRGGGA